MSGEPSGVLPGRGRSGSSRLFLYVAVLVVGAGLVLAGTYSLGIGHARQVLAGGFFNTVGRDVTLGIGVIVTVVLGVLAVARRRRRPLASVLIAVGLAAGWLGWVAGYATGNAEGPVAEYAGSARISAGSQALGSIPVGCSSVVGDPELLAGFAVRTNGFQLNLRNALDRTFQPGIDGEAILSGATVSFGTVSHGADASGFVPLDEVVEDGLEGRATVPAMVASGSSAAASEALVTIEWTCDPATRTSP
jgi:hypothetical protein